MISQVGTSVTELKDGVFFEDIKMEMSEPGHLRVVLTVTPDGTWNKIRHIFFLALYFVKLCKYDPHNDTLCLMGHAGQVVKMGTPKVVYTYQGFQTSYTSLEPVGKALPRSIGSDSKDAKDETILTRRIREFDAPNQVEFVFGVRTSEKIRPRWSFRARVQRLES